MDAVYIVLSEKRQWMHVKALAEELHERGLFMSQAQDPVESLRTSLTYAVHKSANPRGLARHGSMYGLKEWGPEIPPPDDSISVSAVGFPLPLSEQQILAIKERLPPDQFEELFGDLWKRYEEHQRRSLVTQVSATELLRTARREVDRIQDYLLERSRQKPQPEVITNWIVFCYQLELYREGTALFTHVGPDQIGEVLYGYLRRIAQACERHIKG